MVADDFRVEVIGHAALRVQHGGFTLLTDPWLEGPILCGDGCHFPPLVHDPGALAAQTDAIFLSHAHPDHFHIPSLGRFARTTPVYIGRDVAGRFAPRVRSLGFEVIELEPRRRTRVAGSDIRITVVEHDGSDPSSLDTTLVVSTPDFTAVDTNDCPLRRDQYEWIRDNHDVDYAFLGYSSVSHYPLSFEMDAGEKQRLLEESAERHYARFVEAAMLLSARRTVPFANGMRFLQPDALWRNVAFNCAAEAVARLRERGLPADVMGPGDRIEADGTLTCVCEVLGKADELAAIERHARAVSLPAAHRCDADTRELALRLRDRILSLWKTESARRRDVRGCVIAYELAGPAPQQFYFDFSRDGDDVFQWGCPPAYDMRFRYPPAPLAMLLDGELDWDELHFTNEVSIHQVRFAREFDAMLRAPLP